MAESPTQRTLKMLRESGALAEVVERWNCFAGPPQMKCPACGKNKVGVRNDMFGFIDIVALRTGTTGVIGYQATSDNNHADRRFKVLHLTSAQKWVECGNELWIVSWGLRKVEGMAKLKRWQPRLERITVGMFSETLREGSAA